MIVQYIPRRNVTPPFITIKYGLLYNWYVTQDARKISSSDDWIVPSFADYTTLITYTASASNAERLRDTGSTYWNTGTGTNNYLFNFRGSGGRYPENESLVNFSKIKDIGYSWSSYVGVQPGGMLRVLDGNIGSTAAISYTNFKYTGYPIRLIYVGAGTPTEYVGSDGKRYRVITVGTQTYTADNIAETEWRDHSPIDNITDATAWKALTTSAYCAYDNDNNNI